MILYKPTDGDVQTTKIEYRPKTCFIITQLGQPISPALIEIRKKLKTILTKNHINEIDASSQITGKDYSIYLNETHHVHKKDAPSGTAKSMAEIAEKFSKTKVTDIASLRQGEVIGDHTITFESPVDLISIHHHAKTRDIFAEGSLVAAKFLSKKKKGLFNMQDVLGL